MKLSYYNHSTKYLNRRYSRQNALIIHKLVEEAWLLSTKVEILELC